MIASINKTNAVKTCGTYYKPEHIKFDENNKWFHRRIQSVEIVGAQT